MLDSAAVPRTRAASVVWAAAIDAGLVLVFVLIGRRSHEEGLTAEGVLQTAWPFLAALALGWLAARAWRHPSALWPTGVVIWLITVAGGMLLRFASGQGTQLPFIVVATLTLAAFLLGWRLIALVARRRARVDLSRRAP